jgi:hypothetical protein
MLTVQEFRSLFGEESGCGEQLNRQRWPDGFRSPRCDGPSRGYMSDRQGEFVEGSRVHVKRSIERPGSPKPEAL